MCIRALLSEQRDLSLQAAGHSLSAVHLKQRIFVYHRYLVALARSQKASPTVKNPTTSLRKQAMQNEHIKKQELQVCIDSLDKIFKTNRINSYLLIRLNRSLKAPSNKFSAFSSKKQAHQSKRLRLDWHALEHGPH